ncbi:hypothetical protein Scep_008855 [Stephania cephalantha]|uniref:Uncharacterized protein n=1 Tax=Stephania cephalantha TaxID=152367 RepID=A0AAP0JSS5_9MAGN
MMPVRDAVEGVKKKAMWLYPTVSGFNPSERWGHSACSSNGLVYVFGGCCGGLHFGEVLTLDLGKMSWSKLAATGEQPGARDSHSSVLVGQKMIVFGGTNGSKKVNDLHILDLRTKEWSSPSCKGTPPSPRESHSATLVGEDKLVIFGGSGEGEANYLNDLHVLNLRTLEWDSPMVKGDIPAPRDSHIAVAIDNKLLVYGGDRGDRYHGEVDVLDMETLTWSRLVIQGSSPGVRAGHAAVNIGGKVYIIGGVGEKQYFNDVWILDTITCSWTQLDIRGQQPQGRFSHTAVVTDSDIAIYGGCGEDERPLNELLILQLGAEHPNGRYNISLCKSFGNHWNQERKRFIRRVESTDLGFGSKGEQNTKAIELDRKQTLSHNTDNLQFKRRRTSDLKSWEIESEQEEHSLSLSQHSSPSQSDQEQTPIKKLSSSAADSAIVSRSFSCLLKQQNQNSSNNNNNNNNNLVMSQPNFKTSNPVSPKDLNLLGGENSRHLKPKQFLNANPGRQEMQYSAAEHKHSDNAPIHAVLGAEVHGRVDGAFDSGYLMTATVNGMIFRGVLFPPVPGLVPRKVNPPSPLTTPVHGAYVHSKSNINSPPSTRRPFHQPLPFATSESSHHLRQVQSSSVPRPSNFRTDLQDVALTLGGPGSRA